MNTQIRKRTGMWIGVLMLTLTLGVGMMQSTAFAATMGSPLQGRFQPNQQAGADAGTAQGQAPAIPNAQSAPHGPLVSDAYLYMVPEAGAPVNGGTAIVGSRFVLDLMLNAGSNTDVNVQQSYLTFTQATLQNARVSSIATSCVPTNTVTGDLTTFDAALQNEVCNGPGNCTYRGVAVGPGTLAYASGALANPEAGGNFRVAQIGLCAVALGQARLHWEFSPPAPTTRDTEIVNSSGEWVHNPALFTDYIISVANPPTFTPTPTPTPTNTFTNTPTNTFTNTPTRTFTPSNTPTRTYTRTSTPTSTPTNSPTNTPTNTATNTPIATPTPPGSCLRGFAPLGTYEQGDDWFSTTINSFCNASDFVKIARYYGPVDGNGHIIAAANGVSVASTAQLKVQVFLMNATVTVNFNGHLLGFVTIGGTKVYNIPTAWIVLPPNKGVGGNPPATVLNTININRIGTAAFVTNVTLILRGQRPVAEGAGFNPDTTTPNHAQFPTYGYFNPTYWDNTLPLIWFGVHPTRDGHDSIAGGGASLAPQIDRYKTEYGVPKVNIVAHSMGGPWAREYAKVDDPAANKGSLDNVIMLGSPNAGSHWADAALATYSFCSKWPWKFLPACVKYRQRYESLLPAVQQLTTSYMFWYNLTHGPAPCVTYYDQAGQGLPGTDGVVGVWSVQALWYSTHLPVITVGALNVHALLTQLSVFQVPLVPKYNMWNNHYYSGACSGVSRWLAPQIVDPPAPNMWSAIDPPVGTVHAGETQTINVPVDNASSVSFGLGWQDTQTTTLGLSLRDPLGRVITPTSTYNGSAYTSSEDGVMFMINNPLPGTWQVLIEGQTVPGTDGEVYYVAGEINGGVRLDPQLSANFTKLGQPVTLTANLSDASPVSGAAVTADLILSTDSNYTSTLTLTEQPSGSGIYRGSFTPTQPGTYVISFEASGTSNQGRSFTRDAIKQLQASSAAALTGSFIEQVYGTGRYDSLVISSTAVITDAGQYRLNGQLTTPSGLVIASSSGTYTLTAGSVELPLSFDGSTIGAAAADGSYQLRDLYFARTTGDEELTMALVPVAYSTAAYSRYVWPRGNILLTGTPTDQGVDTNGNGLYDYLDVHIPIDVSTAGTYTATLNLVAQDGTPITSVEVPNVSLAQGANTLVAHFNGHEIAVIGINGPYTVEDLAIVDQNGAVVFSQVTAPVLPQTQPYQSIQFEQKTLVGHVTWQGRPVQPNTLQQLPITLTLKSGAGEISYTGMSTDASGRFTVTVDTLPNGSYSWRAKGLKHLASTGTLTLSGDQITNVEMGLLKAGDCNNDNVINVTDFNILRTTFGKQNGDPGYDDRADFTGDQAVLVTDFNLLRGNFGQAGAPPISPLRP